MLRLFVRTMLTDDLGALEQIAEETGEIYRSRNNKKNKNRYSNYFSSTTFTMIESQGIISDILDHRKKLPIWKAMAFSVGLPLCASSQSGPYRQTRAVFSAICQTFPLTEKFAEICQAANVPQALVDPAAIGLYSLSQVLSIRLGHGHKSWNVLDIAKKTVIVGLIHTLSRMITTRVHRVLFFVPDFVISGYIAYQTAPLTERLVRYGVRDSLQYMLEGVVHLFTFLQKPLPDLPDDYLLPIALTCPCCRGLLQDPVETLGYFVCSRCLEQWFARGNFNHPVTGEPISRDLVAHSLLLGFIARKYQMVALRELEARA